MEKGNLPTGVCGPTVFLDVKRKNVMLGSSHNSDRHRDYRIDSEEARTDSIKGLNQDTNTYIRRKGHPKGLPKRVPKTITPAI